MSIHCIYYQFLKFNGIVVALRAKIFYSYFPFFPIKFENEFYRIVSFLLKWRA